MSCHLLPRWSRCGRHCSRTRPPSPAQVGPCRQHSKLVDICGTPGNQTYNLTAARASMVCLTELCKGLHINIISHTGRCTYTIANNHVALPFPPISKQSLTLTTCRAPPCGRQACKYTQQLCQTLCPLLTLSAVPCHWWSRTLCAPSRSAEGAGCDSGSTRARLHSRAHGKRDGKEALQCFVEFMQHGVCCGCVQ